MILTNYETKTELIARKNNTVANYWPVGIDYGFSAVNGFSPNKIFCFPNCAVKVESFSSLIDSADTDILLKDKDGMWIIGKKAHEIISPTDAINYESEMYERNRYQSPIFKALMKAGLGIALLGNEFKSRDRETIVVQTGLPPEYKVDSEIFKEALYGMYNFDLKIGKAPFKHFEFTIKDGNVFVMDQPMGSLFSSITDNSGKQDLVGLNVLKSNTLICDGGFKTLDLCEISAGMFKNSNTFDELGMHEVFKRTIRDAKAKFGTNITMLGMQSALRDGYMISFDRVNMCSKKVEFEDILVKHTEEVCSEAIQKILSLYNYMQNHNYLILTGGTGNAWFSQFEKFFRNMESLTILSANRNDTTLSNTYSNVRGYYYYLISMLNSRRG